MTRIDTGALRDAKLVGLVSFGHMLSHFYVLVLPPVLPLLKDEFAVPYTALGVLMGAFSLAAGLLQTPVGFLVDRIGARKVLICGLLLESACIASIGLTGTFWQMLVLYTLAGAFNTVFHPADYAILSGSVAEDRMGRAFSVHLFSGNMGFALAPATMIALSALWDWRTAFLIVGGVGITLAFCYAAVPGVFRRDGAADPANGEAPAADAGVRGGIRLLLSLPVLMCLLFFIMLTFGFTGIRSYFVTATGLLFGTGLDVANVALTLFLAGSAVGIIAGGILADRVGARVSTAVATLSVAGILIVVMGLVALPSLLLYLFMTVSGFLQGLLLPTRDLLIRSVTPAGSMGKVMGFLSSGMMLSAAVVPVLFGWFLDIGLAAWIFLVSGAFVMGALATFATARARSAAAMGTA